MERWAAVVRVSHMGERRAESDRFHADREQLEPIEAWAAARGVEVEVLPPELGVSGGLPLEQRPSLSRAVEGVESGAFAGIVVAYLSRLGRNVAEQLRVWDRVEQAGGRIVSIREGIDTTTAAGRLHRNLLVSIDAHEREQHAERFEERRRLATEAGIWQRRQTPTGYRKDPQTRKLVPDDRADDVREAFAAAMAGETVMAISHALGLSHSGARQLLRNRVYLGELRVGAHVNVNAHPAIVDVEVFEAVQERLAARARSGRSGRAPALLAGLVRCCSCGHVMTRGSSRKTPTYVCPTHHSGQRCPRPASIGAGRLDPYVERIALAELERVWVSADQGDRPGQIRRQIADERRDLDALLDRFGSEVGAEVIERQVAKRSARIAELEAEMRTESGRLAAIPGAERGSEVWEGLSGHERNTLLRGLLAAVVVRPAGRGRKLPVGERALVYRFAADLKVAGGRGGVGAGIVPIPFNPDAPGVLGVLAAEDGA